MRRTSAGKKVLSQKEIKDLQKQVNDAAHKPLSAAQQKLAEQILKNAPAADQRDAGRGDGHTR
jgi:hypothetical protein